MSQLTIVITINRLASYASGNTRKFSFSKAIKQLPNSISFNNKNHFTNGSVV
ncbi:hypothetical protein [Vibrio cincinnatiensis]|uniref:hypothetical protein n=1 Tax=Vibrio cincinnatiensis TaxID=675 RepID=UPI001EDCBE67|nr:hypothetical protein [Vibrio cincinnatiensis]